MLENNTLSKSTKIFTFFFLLDRLEGKEPEMGNAYSLQVKRWKEVRCWETANKSFDKAFDVLRFRAHFEGK